MIAKKIKKNPTISTDEALYNVKLLKAPILASANCIKKFDWTAGW